MSTIRRNYAIKAPFKGMLSGNNPTINPAYFSKAYNIFFDKNGVPEKRPGVTKICDSVIYNTSTGLHFSNDDPTTRGITWTDLGQQASQTHIGSFANLGSGIALAGTAVSGKILRSTDYGATWADLGQQASQTHIYTLVSLGGGIVLAGTGIGGKILRSTDSGLTWTDLGQQFSQIDIVCLANLGGGVVLAGTIPGGKILRSTDYGATWTDLGQQFSQLDIISLANLGGGIALAGAGGPDGKILRSTDYGATWADLGQQASQTDIYALVGLGGGIALAGTYPDGKILRSTDYGATWADLGQQFSQAIILSFANLGSGIVLAGTTAGGKILRSTDSGLTWTDLGQQASETDINNICHLDGGIILAGTGLNGKILRSTNSSSAAILDSNSGFGNFRAGLKILVSGTTNNDGVYEVYSVASGQLTLKANETLVTETPASATVYLLAKIEGFYEYIKQGTSGSPTTNWIFNIDKYIIASRRDADPDIDNAIKSDCTPGKPDYAILQDKLYIANGEDVLQVYSGTGNAEDIDSPPGEDEGLENGTFCPSFIEVHQWCLWAAGVPGHPSRIYKSAPLDGEDFQTNYAAMDTIDGYALAGAAAIDVRPDDGTRITGMVGDHFGQLFIFKEMSIHRILGATKADFVMPPEGIINGIGGYNGSIVVAHNEIYFMSLKGFHTLSTVERFGDNAETFLSLDIQEFFNGLDKGQFDECSSCHWPDYNIILWSLRLQGAENNNILFIYNYIVKAWSITTDIEITSLSLLSFHRRKVAFLGDSYGRFCRFNPAMMNDYGSAFTAELETAIDLNDPYLIKAWRNLFLHFNPIGGDVIFKFKVDDEDWSDEDTFSASSDYPVLGVFLLGTDSLVGSSKSVTGECEINRAGKKLTINMQNSTLNEKMSIFGFGGQYLPQGYR